MNKTIKNILLRLSMLIGVFLFIALLVNAISYRKNLLVKKINISIDEYNGNFFISKTQIDRLLKDNFSIINEQLSGNDLEQIEKKVKNIAQVKDADAYIDNQGNLTVNVIQRKPIARIYSSTGKTFYIDENAVKFATTANYTAKVPVITGLVTENYKVEKVQSTGLKRVFTVLQYINTNKTWQAMIGQYNINANAQLELIPRFGSATILFGDDKNCASKIKKLDVFYFDVLKKVGWDYYKVINIMYKDQVVCLK